MSRKRKSLTEIREKKTLRGQKVMTRERKTFRDLQIKTREGILQVSEFVKKDNK